MGSYHEEGFLQRLYRKLTTLDERSRLYILLAIFNIMILFMIVQALQLRQVEIQLQAFQVEVTRLVEVQLACQQDCKATVLATVFAPPTSSTTIVSTLTPTFTPSSTPTAAPTTTPTPSSTPLPTPTHQTCYNRRGGAWGHGLGQGTIRD